MASRWEDLRAAVTTAVEALTPEDDAGVTYHEAKTDSVLSGVSSRRAFWQEPPQALLMSEQSSDTITIRYSWALVVILRPDIASKPDFADACATEALNITRAILTLAPTTGAQPIIVPSWSVAEGASPDEIEIAINLVSEIQEVL